MYNTHMCIIRTPQTWPKNGQTTKKQTAGPMYDTHQKMAKSTAAFSPKSIDVSW